MQYRFFGGNELLNLLVDFLVACGTDKHVVVLICLNNISLNDNQWLFILNFGKQTYIEYNEIVSKWILSLYVNGTSISFK